VRSPSCLIPSSAPVSITRGFPGSRPGIWLPTGSQPIGQAYPGQRPGTLCCSASHDTSTIPSRTVGRACVMRLMALRLPHSAPRHSMLDSLPSGPLDRQRARRDRRERLREGQIGGRQTPNLARPTATSAGSLGVEGGSWGPRASPRPGASFSGSRFMILSCRDM